MNKPKIDVNMSGRSTLSSSLGSMHRPKSAHSRIFDAQQARHSLCPTTAIPKCPLAIVAMHTLQLAFQHVVSSMQARHWKWSWMACPEAIPLRVLLCSCTSLLTLTLFKFVQPPK